MSFMNSAGESKLSCVANSRYNNSKIQALHACRTSCLKILSFMNSAGESKLSCVANSEYNNSKIQALHACRTSCLKIPGIYKAVLFLCFILSYIAKKSKMVKVLIWKATFKTENFSTKSFGIYRLFLDVAKST